MNKLPTPKRIAVLSALCEGLGINAVCRLTGVAKNTVLKLLADAGLACARYQHEHMRNLPCTKLQCDEIWGFCAMKQKNVPPEKQGILGYGDVWVWMAMDADTKLVPSWLVGARDSEHACAFIADLAGRLANRVQMTTDGLNLYLKAVEEGFGGEIDYAQLIKMYETEEGNGSDVRYGPGEYVELRKVVVTGSPDWKDISTSFIERQNLTLRMRQRRFTRLTNAFSKKLANLEHAVALHYMHYNFVRRHQTLRCSPAMRAGVTNRLWSIEDVVKLIG